MDYDDQMVFACRILRRFPDLLAYYQTRFPYLCVDEAQDTSKIQHKILRLLAARSRNLFLVGDEDQSIYGFRAAWPQALLEFQTVYPEARVLLMETNYRSTRSIVAKADAFIQRNQSRHAKHMTTDNPRGSPFGWWSWRITAVSTAICSGSPGNAAGPPPFSTATTTAPCR